MPMLTFKRHLKWPQYCEEALRISTTYHCKVQMTNKIR